MRASKKPRDYLKNIHGLWLQLPLEILTSIFSYVPLGSLIECRRVCKGWYLCLKNIRSDPDFGRLHYTYTNQQDDQPGFLLFNSGDKFYTVDYQALENQDTTLEAQVIKFNLPTDQNFKIIGSSNGLLCFTRLPKYESFYIVNPITKETIELLNPPDTESIHWDKYKYYCGFTFDTSTEEYKIIRFVQVLELPHWRSEVQIYTLGSGSWRAIEISNGAIITISFLLLNGALHFLTADSFLEKQKIIALDIGSEKSKTFGMLPGSSMPETLFLFGECLGLLDRHGGSKIELWIMKEYGLNDSWCKEYVINMEAPRHFFRNLNILIRLKNGAMFFLQDSFSQGYFDPENEAAERVYIRGISNLNKRGNAVFVRKASLISPQCVLP